MMRMSEHMHNDVIILAIFAIIAELLLTIIALAIFLHRPTLFKMILRPDSELKTKLSGISFSVTHAH